MPLPPVLFDPTTIPDVTLASLRKLCVERAMPKAPRLAGWIHAWCDREQFARATDPERRMPEHLVDLPDTRGWSDAELGRSLRVVVALTCMTMPDSLGTFLDRVLVAIAEAAAERLEARHQ